MMEFTLSWKILRLVVRMETNIDVDLLITIHIQMQNMAAYHESPYMEELREAFKKNNHLIIDIRQ